MQYSSLCSIERVSTIEALATRIAEVVTLRLSLEKEKQSVIRYGLIGMLQILTLFFMTVIMGLLTKTLYESIVVFLAVGFIRKSTGGAHAKTMGGCNSVSILSIAILAITSRYFLGVPIDLIMNIGITTIVFLISFYIFYLRVPVDSPNKPIVNPEKIRRLRRESFGKLIVLMILTIIAFLAAAEVERLYSIASSLRVAVLWQTFTLTNRGGAVLATADTMVGEFFNQVQQRVRRGH